MAPRRRRLLRRATLAFGVALGIAVASGLAPTASAAGGVAAGPVPAAPAVSAAALPVVVSTVTVRQDGRQFRARLTQPSTARPDSYPVISFGHGFLQSTGRYASTMSSLAARGYVVIAPDTQVGFLPSHSRLADDLWAAAAWAERTQPNAAPGLVGVVGHSMGGGAALIAAERHPEVRAVATLAAAQTRPSATAAAVRAPALFVVGTEDSIIRPATTRAMYDAKPAPAKWAAITGGFHCGFLDSSSFFGVGCDTGNISRSAQLGLTSQLLGEWLDNVLRGGSAPVTPAGVVVEAK